MTVVELVRSPLELEPLTEAEGSTDNAGDGELDETPAELPFALDDDNPVEAPAGEDGIVDGAPPLEAVVALAGSEVGPAVVSSEDEPLLDGPGPGEDLEEGASDGAGHDEPQDPLGQGHDPVQEPVQEPGHGVLDGEGRPLEGATVRLVPGAVALGLSADDKGEVTADPDEETAGVALELKFPVGDTGSPVLEGAETGPGAEDKGVLSTLLDAEAEVMLFSGEDELGAVAGPVDGDESIPELVAIPPVDDT